MRCTMCVVMLLLAFQVVRAEEGSAEFTEKARFTWLKATGVQREVCVIIPSSQEPDCDVEADRFQRGTMSVLVLTDSRYAGRAATSEDPAPEDEDASAALRLKLSVALNAGLGKLGADGPARKYTRVTVLACGDSCVPALKLSRAAKLDCDQLVLVNPVIEDLPAIGDEKPRPIDVVIYGRSDAEINRSRQAVLSKLGTWGDTARLFASRGVRPLVETWVLLRGYALHRPQKSPKTATRCDFSDVVEALAQADVVFAGELHGNPGAHVMQFDLLESMAKTAPVALVTEQFERDTQTAVDGFLRLNPANMKPAHFAQAEQEFREASRAWPNYADYRPMVELCRSQKLPVIAGNVPRRLAARINKEGLEAFDKFSAEDKAWCAKKLNTPDGAYKDKFFEVMGTSTGAKKDEKYAAMERMYAAQCLKDDTMAESIIEWLDANKGGKVLHINGAFHSAGGLGIPEKVKALRPGLKIVVITCEEADNPSLATLDADVAKGNDFVAFVPASRPNRRSEGPVHPK